MELRRAESEGLKFDSSCAPVEIFIILGLWQDEETPFSILSFRKIISFLAEAVCELYVTEVPVWRVEEMKPV